jgi:hypothetical protein
VNRQAQSPRNRRSPFVVGRRAVMPAIAIAALAAAAMPDIAQSADAPSGKPAAAKVKSHKAGGASDPVVRGKYLVMTSGCHDCHTPWKMGANGPEADMTRMLSGHPQDMQLPPPPKPVGPWIVASAATNTAHAGPWGVSFTANLTPDPETGLGKWTLRNFMDTIRSGRHQGRGREILPPMPILVYKNFTDADLGAIFAYLRTIPTIVNKVPEPLPPAEPAAAPPK